MTWNDTSHTLTIGSKKGSYNGMLSERKFTVRTPNGNEKTITYKGKKVTVKM